MFNTEVIADKCLVKMLFDQIRQTQQWRMAAYYTQIKWLREVGASTALIRSAHKARREYRVECDKPMELEHNGRRYSEASGTAIVEVEIVL